MSESGFVSAKHCPICEGETKVYDSRAKEDGQILRYRECLKCGAKYITNESFSRFVYRKEIKIGWKMK